MFCVILTFNITRKLFGTQSPWQSNVKFNVKMNGRGFLPIGSCSMINILISIAKQNWTFRSKRNFGSIVSLDLPFKLNPVWFVLFDF